MRWWLTFSLTFALGNGQVLHSAPGFVKRFMTLKISNQLF
jgi:hypothetical protein